MERLRDLKNVYSNGSQYIKQRAPVAVNQANTPTIGIHVKPVQQSNPQPSQVNREAARSPIPAGNRSPSGVKSPVRSPIRSPNRELMYSPPRATQEQHKGQNRDVSPNTRNLSNYQPQYQNLQPNFQSQTQQQNTVDQRATNTG